MGVEQRQMGGRIEQCLMLVLSVKLDEPLGEVPQRGRGGERAIDERPAAALAGDFPADDQFPQLASGTGVFEDCFDAGLALAGSNEVG